MIIIIDHAASNARIPLRSKTNDAAGGRRQAREHAQGPFTNDVRTEWDGGISKCIHIKEVAVADKGKRVKKYKTLQTSFMSGPTPITHCSRSSSGWVCKQRGATDAAGKWCLGCGSRLSVRAQVSWPPGSYRRSRPGPPDEIVFALLTSRPGGRGGRENLGGMGFSFDRLQRNEY